MVARNCAPAVRGAQLRSGVRTILRDKNLACILPVDFYLSAVLGVTTDLRGEAALPSAVD